MPEGDLPVRGPLVLPARELHWRFSRSSGPGGQGVNTADSRVELSFDLKASGWPVRVQALEMLGAERLVYGLLGETLFTARLDATMPHPKVGDIVAIHAAPSHVHWFDAATTARVGA